MYDRYDKFLAGCNLVKNLESFYLQGEHDQIYIGCDEIAEDSETGKRLSEYGFMFEDDLWFFWT